ncbi:hypothetical protein Q1695_012647 [Nippostrongylus brasiliensis]|nr:hypothetical protein Q1695_012647 [Nippostrongylus brasiliensis]
MSRKFYPAVTFVFVLVLLRFCRLKGQLSPETTATRITIQHNAPPDRESNSISSSAGHKPDCSSFVSVSDAECVSILVKQRFDLDRTFVDQTLRPVNYLLVPDLHRTQYQKVLLTIPSTVDDFLTRKLWRLTYCKPKNKAEFGYNCIFSIGTTNDSSVLEQIEDEAYRFGDILQADIVDSYRNLTLKMLSIFRYVVAVSSDVKAVLKIDADISWKIRHLIQFINYAVSPQKAVFYCHRVVDEKEYPGDDYPTFCLGWCYIATVPALDYILYNVPSKRFFWLEDVFITGILNCEKGASIVNMGTKRAYNSVRHHIVAEVIQRVSSRYPKAKMFDCGFSMGGMVLLNYLATCTAETAVLSGALVVSAPFDPHSTTRFAERYREHYENHEMMDFNNVLKSVTIREFDTRFTAPLFGYDSVDHYYDHAAPNKKVKKIPIPTLCLNADDDCFSPYDGHGSSFSNLSGEFAIGISTACTIAHEVARAIIDELHDCAFPTPNVSTWAMALEGFRTRWDYPAAMGALDGKHIACVCPNRSGSLFYNYKNYYSTVLLALVDANYKCVLYDLGAAGRSSDAGVFYD